MIIMNKETLEALQGSIRKWENIVAGTEEDEGQRNCPLCQLFCTEESHCDNCPVAQAVQADYCNATPYATYRIIPSIKNAKAELDFLKSLLPAQTGEPAMSEFKKYHRKGYIEAKPYSHEEGLPEYVSISAADRDVGSPKIGDMIARNPDNHNDQWLIAQDYFEKYYELRDIPRE